MTIIKVIFINYMYSLLKVINKAIKQFIFAFLLIKKSIEERIKDIFLAI